MKNRVALEAGFTKVQLLAIMDISPIFRQLVASLAPGSEPSLSIPDSFEPHPEVAQWNRQAETTRLELSNVETFLFRVAPGYVNVRPFLASDTRSMDNDERDEIDRQLSSMLHAVSKLVGNLRFGSIRLSLISSAGSAESRVSSCTGARFLVPDLGSSASHRAGLVAALLQRVSELSATLTRMQALRCAAVTEARAPFASYLNKRLPDNRFLTSAGLPPLPPSTEKGAKFSRGDPEALLRAINVSVSELPPSERLLAAARKVNLLPCTMDDSIASRAELVSAFGVALGSAASRSLEAESPELVESEVAAVCEAARVSASGPALLSMLRTGDWLGAPVEEDDLLRAMCSPSCLHVFFPGESTSQLGNLGSGSFKHSPTADVSRQRPEVALLGMPARSVLATGKDSPLVQEETTARQRPPELQAILESENAALSASLAGELDGVLATENRMREVAELMSHFSAHVAEQAEQVDSIEATTTAVDEDVTAGHEQLLKAHAAGRRARHLYVGVVLALSFALLFIDLIFD